MRPVLAVAGSSNADGRTTVTCGEEGGRACTAAELTGASKLVLTGKDGNRYRLGPVVIDGNDVATAAAVRSPFGDDWAVEYDLTTEGADRFALATERVAALAPPRNAIAIVVAGRVVSAPFVHAVIPEGRIQLTGDFTQSEAKALAAQLGGSVA